MKISEKKILLRQLLIDRGLSPDQVKVWKKPFVLIVKLGTPIEEGYITVNFNKRKPDAIKQYSVEMSKPVLVPVPESVSRGEDGLNRLADMAWVIAKYCGMV